MDTHHVIFCVGLQANGEEKIVLKNREKKSVTGEPIMK
jgi:hypothetical protein